MRCRTRSLSIAARLPSSTTCRARQTASCVSSAPASRLTALPLHHRARHPGSANIRRKSRRTRLRRRRRRGAARTRSAWLMHVVVVGGGNAALTGGPRRTRARRRGHVARARAVRVTRRQFALHGRRHAHRLRGRGGLAPSDAGTHRRRDGSRRFGSYSREQFYDDLGRVTQYRIDRPIWRKSWLKRASRRCYGCTAWACASCRCTAGSRLR